MGGELNFGSRTWTINLVSGFWLLSLASVKIADAPPVWERLSQHKARITSGNSNGLADCKSQGLSGTPEQQPMGARICFSAEGCMWVGPV
jgi:hypothetical protein